jgi:hypothetical protein
MQNGKVGKGDVFFLNKTFLLPYLHKNLDLASSRLHLELQTLE